MTLTRITIAAAMLGLSMNAFAAVSDLSSVTHGTDYGQELRTGKIVEPAFSDRNAKVLKRARGEVKPFAKSAGNYRFSDITSVTHN